jgi:hypothetical protein
LLVLPQLISTLDGEIGCAFYEYWTQPAAEFTQSQFIDVILAVSNDDGLSFPNRVTVTDNPWDPTVDPVFAHGNPNVTFIGDYFGFAASSLGFFPFWTDTRTGVRDFHFKDFSVSCRPLYPRFHFRHW